MTKRKLPYKELAILSICRIAEPIAMSSIFPYLPEMIEYFGIQETEVAKWAGITSAIFSLCQSCTGVLWGRLSDRIGRKPVVLICLTNTMVTALLWGFSVNLPMAVVARALSGAGNGNVGILRTIVAELCPWKELQPRAFSIMPLVWTIGSVIGPAMGGALANPMHVEPGKPHGNSLLEKFPYLLPNLISAIIFTSGIIVGILFLRETLETRRDRPDVGLIAGQKLTSAIQTQYARTKRWILPRPEGEREPLIKDDDIHHQRPAAGRARKSRSSDPEAAPSKPKEQQEPPTWGEVLTRQAVINLLIYMLIAFYMIGYDQALPVFMHHPIQPTDGPKVHLPFVFGTGFGMKNARIGLLFTIYGVASILCQFLIFPPIATRLGPLRSLRLVMGIIPFVFFITPFTALLPTSPNLQQPAMEVVMIMKGFCSVIAFPSSTILLTNSATSLRTLGTLNGWATSVSALGRAAGPGLGGAFFTLGARHGCVGIPFWFFAVVAALANIPLYFLEEGDGFGDDPKESPAPEQRDVVVEQSNVVDPHSVIHDQAEDEVGAERSDTLTPLISRTTSRASVRHSSFGSAISSMLSFSRGYSQRESEENAVESDDDSSSDPDGDSGPPEQVDGASNARPGIRRKSSVPLGMGTGFRRLSSNLGQSRSGYGTGAFGD